MKIEIALQTHNFNRRLCWMLSSLLQQYNKETLSDISVSIAYILNSGKPPVEEIVKEFSSKGLKINSLVYDNIEKLQYRGLVRNKQIQTTDADWLLFADSDVVYPRNYFSKLKSILESSDYRNSSKCLHSARKSTFLNETVNLVDKRINNGSCVIDDAYKQADRLEAVLKSNIGAGYCQIVNVDVLKLKYGGLYVDPKGCKDHSWITGIQKTKSDQQFRRQHGRKPLDLPVQIHLQHLRDNEVGYHLEIQR